MSYKYVPLLLLFSLSTTAGEAIVVDAKATATNTGLYRFDVTLRHADSGWDHYADSWEVVAPSSVTLAKRILYHPHVDEQPFTRSLAGVAIPEDIDWIGIRAHDKLHGDSSRLFRIELAR